MGPADPFSDRGEHGRSSPASASEAPRSEGRAPSSSSGGGGGRSGVWAGFGVGAFFGILIVLFGFGPALFVLALGALGGLAGWLARGVLSGGLDPGAAWRALRRR